MWLLGLGSLHSSAGPKDRSTRELISTTRNNSIYLPPSPLHTKKTQLHRARGIPVTRARPVSGTSPPLQSIDLSSLLAVQKRLKKNVEIYNSVIIVSDEGRQISNYRKRFLNHCNKAWTLEGDAFFDGEVKDLGNVTLNK